MCKDVEESEETQRNNGLLKKPRLIAPSKTVHRSERKVEERERKRDRDVEPNFFKESIAGCVCARSYAAALRARGLIPS